MGIGVDSDEISSFLNWKHQFNESSKDNVPNVKKKILHQSKHIEQKDTNKKGKGIECDECKMSFSKKSNFMRHHKRKHPNNIIKIFQEEKHKVKEYDCKLCGAQYKGKV